MKKILSVKVFRLVMGILPFLLFTFLPLSAQPDWAKKASKSVFTLKTFTASKRPDSDATNSFPSGHTATAFLGAELVRLEYGTGWAIGAYSIATLTAVMRVYHDRHRIEDTLAGAGIGILSAHIAHRLLPVWKELLNLESSPLQVSALPCCMPTQKGAVAGLALSVRF